MRKLLAFFLIAIQCGCAGAMPAYIPTGNPVTDVLATAAVYELGGALTREILGTGDCGGYSLAALMPARQQTRTVRGIKFIGEWE